MQDLAGVTADTATKEDLLRGALAMMRALEPASRLDIALAQDGLAVHLLAVRRYDEARLLAIEAVETLQQVVGERHTRFLAALGTLGNAYTQSDDLRAAERTHRRLLASQRDVFGPESFQVANTWNNLAVVLVTAGRYAEGREAAETSFRLHAALFGDRHWRSANAARNVGRIYELERRFPSALQWLHRAAAIYTAAEGPQNQNVVYIRAQTGPVLLRLGRAADAERVLSEALAGLEASAAEAGEARLADVRIWLGRVLVERGRPAAARRHLERAVAYRQRAHAANHPRLAEASCDLALALSGEGRRTEAAALFATCAPIYRSWGLADPVVVAAIGRAASPARLP
jgi:tetratricopeptide (TPR) repeat protein